MLTKIKLISMLLVASVVLMACGQKGPLYKSPEAEANKAKPVSEQTSVSQVQQQNTKD